MKCQCSICGNTIESQAHNKFVVCYCESIFVDGSYDQDGKQLLHRYGYLKEGAEIIHIKD